jgi:hypothetical protein
LCQPLDSPTEADTSSSLSLKFNPAGPDKERVMYNKGKFDNFRAGLADAITGLLFTAVVVIVVGGTTAMCLERAPIFA